MACAADTRSVSPKQSEGRCGSAAVAARPEPVCVIVRGRGAALSSRTNRAQLATLEIMVTMNIQVDDALFERLRELAKKTGQTAEQAATDLLASLSSDGVELDDDQEAAVAEGFAQLDRGEHVAEAQVIAKLDALRR